ncbi:class I SAM-dependent methyltransferase [Gulosibacter chungangensis]|uniref:Class I SAM-dependent methyltransferase n=1 Tax=Gulosibacter chungangensis TaxID=979746 RepID=A0A7J5BF81_9MICO|nr:class I SAM-dependent methyltransferase [Gulosibacter chungangensis]KAB1644926.1 class I SAM-dependent methyltransferase [Gulosibacter chungangensis]
MNDAHAEGSPQLPGHKRSPEKAAGHWLLARVGKRVLPPGGRETTDWLVSQLTLQGKDVVELAPGLGITAKELILRVPKSYVGVDEDADAVENTRARLREVSSSGVHPEVVNASAQCTGLEADTADVVMCEAMLTMQGDRTKLEIMREAARILRPGGTYAIHELALVPDGVGFEVKDDIRKALAKTIRVNARPMTVAEWQDLADQAGFDVVATRLAPMALLKPQRMIADEGVPRTLKIAFNILRQPKIRKRILGMRAVFNRYSDQLRGIGMVLRRREENQ